MRNNYIVRVAFLDVGQGDSIVVSIPETKEAIIVDCADPIVVFEYLQNQGIEFVRSLIITHLHSDHYRGVVQFLDYWQEKGKVCERVIFNWCCQEGKRQPPPDEDGHCESGDPKSNSRRRMTSYREFISKVGSGGFICEPLIREGNSKPFFGNNFDQIIEILQPSYGQLGKLQQGKGGLNNTSAILKVHGTGSTALLTGDVEPYGWSELQKRHVELKCDILKFPHHGGAWQKTETDELLEAVKPVVVIISVGTTQNYDHPKADVLKSLRNHKATQLLCTQATDKCGASEILQRKEIIKQFEKEYLDGDKEWTFSRNGGCPCAGSIVVELGEKAEVERPKRNFHHKIIEGFFSKNQCYLLTEARN